jgi:hypothetical protein
MLNGTVEPLLTMTSSTNRLMSMTKTNGDSNTNNSDTSSKRSTMKIASSTMMSPMNSNNNNNNNNSSMNSDNRIKFVDMLVCGSCQQDFQLSDIVKFIEHKAICGNKENKRKIPYFLSQQRPREGDDDDEDDEDDDEDKSQQSGNSSGNENEHHSHRQQLLPKQSKFSKVLVDASANTLHNSGTYIYTKTNDLYKTKSFSFF